MTDFGKKAGQHSGGGQQEDPQGTGRMKYAAPRLIEYGSFTKLTQGGAAGLTEGGGSMSPACL